MKKSGSIFLIGLAIIIFGGCHQPLPPEIKNLAPKIPINIFPLDNAANLKTMITFRWQAEDPNENDTLSFDFYLQAGNPNPSRLFSNLVADSLVLHSLIYDTTYYWKVVAKDRTGDSTSSSIWRFTTRHEFNASPHLPSAVAPLDNAQSVSINNVVLTWIGSDPDYFSILCYDVLFGQQPDSLSMLSQCQSEGSFSLGLLRYNTKYFWQIIAKDDYDSIKVGPIWNFETLLAETIFNGSFDLDNVNEAPSLIKWSISELGAKVIVSDEKRWNNFGHSACLVDTTTEGSCYLAATIDEKELGMLQFYFLITSDDDYWGVRLYSGIADSTTLGPQISIREGKLQYYDKSQSWKTILTIKPDKWYLSQIVFDCTKQFYDIYIDDRKLAESVTWTGTSVPAIKYIYFLTFDNRTCHKAFIDEVQIFANP